MELTPTDMRILRQAEIHGSYRVNGYANNLRALMLVASGLLRDNDNSPGVYTITADGEAALVKMDKAA